MEKEFLLETYEISKRARKNREEKYEGDEEGDFEEEEENEGEDVSKNYGTMESY